MKHTLTQKVIKKFKAYLQSEEKSVATIEKYMRDIKAFSIFITNQIVDKETVLRYKEHLIKVTSKNS